MSGLFLRLKIFFLILPILVKLFGIEENKKENAKLNKVYDFLENGIYNKEEFIKRSKSIKDNIQNLESKLYEYNSLLQKNVEMQNAK